MTSDELFTPSVPVDSGYGREVTSITDRAPSAAEREVTGERVRGALAGREISVPPVKAWRASAIKALTDGDFDVWAEKTLTPEDLEVWDEIDPTLGEIEAFFAAVNPGLGTGNSRASRRSSRGTQRR